MTEPIKHRIPSAAGRASVRLVQLSPAVLAALLDGDLAGASARAGVALTDFFLAEEALWLWRLRLDQIAADPGSARWVARAAVAEPEGEVVGYAGFHGPPDAAGMVEVGYSVAPDRRRRGHARAILAELLRWAGAESGVRTVRASIRPDNTASLATISGFGFVEVGEQWDEVDGRELLFECPEPH
ncbi:ribosomal-protein-alanine N-acetyltransferase [Kitasatospora sp. MAA4]|uniref:GNAT family N-acetyltransferase n=1 Tax=Kitasatospora sp. MAA4 TaxID=3035093 RepID=UPI0024762344|nr:GNAT family protein [Kitasatospora sp. MAA4]MDH6132150.1 ribosomal-protein-alanine N-acetyltransferase [Kitasatospora sp. MAA4]